MAVIWQKKIAGTHYEVRVAGQTRRLYTNGVCHSEFNPSKVVTGSIWDLLVLPALFYEPDHIKRVLMLGVGGGGSILQMHHLLETVNITGVDLNPVHLDIAKRFFNIDTTSVELYHCDAGDWLDQYNGERFDLIVDDLFSAEAAVPQRAVEADSAWFKLLLKHLSTQGLLVSNFGSLEEYRESGYFRNMKVRERFAGTFQVTTPLLENVVGVFIRKDADSKTLRKNIHSHPILSRALQSKQIRYRIKRIHED
jgi:spermidine synthase